MTALSLRAGVPPRPPLWPGGKPKVYFWTGVLMLVVGALVLVRSATARIPRRAALPLHERYSTGASLTVLGGLLAGLTRGGRARQRRGRAALDVLAREHGLSRPHPDVAEGRWSGVPIAVRVAYGAIGTSGDARAWLVEVGEAPRRGWAIVHDRLDDERAIAARLPSLCDAAVATSRTMHGA